MEELIGWGTQKFRNSKGGVEVLRIGQEKFFFSTRKVCN